MGIPILALFLATLPASASTSARIVPDTVAPGSTATLTIITDTGATPIVQKIAGGRIVGTGRSTQVQFVNGAVSQQATFSYAVVPGQVGDLQLGPFKVGQDTTPALTLHVDPAASNAAATPTAPSMTWRAVPDQAAPPQPADEGERAYAQMWLGDTTPVVGQAIPLTISAFLRDDVGGTLEAAPSIDAPDFVVAGLDEEPTRQDVDVDGATYTRFTWTANLTPVRPGDYDLHTSIPATLQWVERVRSQRHSMLEEMLADDPFFRGSGMQRMLQGFGGIDRVEPQVRSAHVDLAASRSLTIASPPAEGRPEGFTGAVGDFTVALAQAPTTASVGEPVELHWTIDGTGNFDAIEVPGVPDGEAYDTYPPERSFTPTVRSRTKGTLAVTQLVVPREPGELALPPLDLSWFDPEAGAYRTASLDLPPLEVTGVAATQAVLTPGSPAATPSEGQAPRDVRSPRLLPRVARAGVVVVPVLLWLLVAVMWLGRDRLARGASAASGALGRRWRSARLRRRVLRAARAGDVEGVFQAGLELVRTQAAQADEPHVRAFVEQAERSLYGRMPPEQAALEELARDLLDNLDHKEAA